MGRRNKFKGASADGRGVRRWAKNWKKNDLTVPKIVAQCREYPIPYLNIMSRNLS